MTTSPSAAPYRFCTREEVQELQELQQVSELEASLETCQVPQAQRRLDPCLALAKFRRSAAGAEMKEPRSAEALMDALHHLIEIGATFQASPQHPRVDNVDTVVNFVVDRLRACQSDATRLSGGDTSLPAIWHAQAIRLLIWMQYLWSQNCDASNNKDSLLPRTIHTIRSTAYDAYWSVREAEVVSMTENESIDDSQNSLDDEMLCYDAVSRIASTSLVMLMDSSSASSLESSWSGLLLEFTKRQQTTMPVNSSFPYSLWKQALQVAALASRQEFHSLLRSNKQPFSSMPILARCILSSVRFPWMYRTVQQYNVSFGKGEAVKDMERLLGIAKENWSVKYASCFGVPVTSFLENENDFDAPVIISMVMKKEAMMDMDKERIQQRKLLQVAIQDDQKWVLGDEFDSSEPLGIYSGKLSRLLRSENFEGMISKGDAAKSNTSGLRPKPSSLSSLAAALSKVDAPDVRAKPKPAAKKGPSKCKFYAMGTCRFGDKCRFDHS